MRLHGEIGRPVSADAADLLQELPTRAAHPAPSVPPGGHDGSQSAIMPRHAAPDQPGVPVLAVFARAPPLLSPLQTSGES